MVIYEEIKVNVLLEAVRVYVGRATLVHFGDEFLRVECAMPDGEGFFNPRREFLIVTFLQSGVLPASGVDVVRVGYDRTCDAGHFESKKE